MGKNAIGNKDHNKYIRQKRVSEKSLNHGIQVA